MDQLSTLSLRPVTDGDYPFLIGLYRSTREHELVLFGFSEEQKQHFVSSQFAAQDSYYRENYPHATFDVVLHDDEAIGRLYVDEWKDEFRIIDIALLPEFCNKGVGSKFLKAVLARAAEVRKRVSIHVEQNNPARRLYQRLGFEKTGEHGIYDLMVWQAASTDAV